MRYAVRAVRRRLPLFLVCVVLVPAVAVVASVLEKKQYSATASLLFRDPQFDQKLFSSSFVQNESDPTRQAATNLDLVSLPRVAALTAAHLHTVTERQVESAVSESSEGQSDLVSIQATASTPALSAKMANAFATQYIAFRRDADRATVASAELPLRRQIAALPRGLRDGALGQSLQSRLSELNVLASLQTGNAELVQPAEVPGGPSSPKPVRNGALGIFFGLLLGAGLVLLAEALDRRLRDPDEVEQIFERPVLTLVPESDALTKLDAALEAVPEAEREAFRMLWANLRYFTISRDIRSVLIASADRDDGKSTVAWGLAVAAANAGKRTLVVEADLHKPTFASRFDVTAPIGLTNVLAGDVTLANAILRYRFPHFDEDVRPTRSIDALFAGPRPPNPSDLLQSHGMVELVREARHQYDLIVIDTPPAGAVSDAIPLITMVDGVIVVSRLGKTVRDHARRLRQQLDHLDASVLGVVVNSAEEDRPYGYDYGYGEDLGPASPATRTNGAAPLGDRHPAPAVAPPRPGEGGWAESQRLK
jgi:non-specific protein-tyrosine kinase